MSTDALTDPAVAVETLSGRATAQGVRLDLRAHFDCRGITSAGELGEGGLNLWGNSLPAEELAPRGSGTRVGRVDFDFPAAAADGTDHVRCSGQRIDVPVGRYDWIHVLAAAERRTEDRVALYFRRIEPPRDGPSVALELATLRVSDFWPETPPWFGEPDGIAFHAMHYPRHIETKMAPSIWRTRVPVAREEPLEALQLPDNPAIHVFAMTLEPAVGTVVA